MRYVRFNDEPDERIPIDRCEANSIYAIRVDGTPYKLQRVEDRWWWLRADQSEGWWYESSFISLSKALEHAMIWLHTVSQLKDEIEFGDWLKETKPTTPPPHVMPTYPSQSTPAHRINLAAENFIMPPLSTSYSSESFPATSRRKGSKQ